VLKATQAKRIERETRTRTKTRALDWLINYLPYLDFDNYINNGFISIKFDFWKRRRAPHCSYSVLQQLRICWHGIRIS